MKTAEAPPPQHSGGPGGSSSTGYFYWSSSARCSVLAVKMGGKSKTHLRLYPPGGLSHSVAGSRTRVVSRRVFEV
ncbi:hypothetical protein YC2023_019328 [Brassica napus]